MFTPQQIEQISFGKATFGGYDMKDVDSFLEPLTEAYVTIYKENALLKSKMRVLVNKLEEYRNSEASMKDAIADAQKTCDTMVKDTESKCTQMLDEANVQLTKANDALIAAENARVEKARREAADKISQIEDQLRQFLDTLAQIREADLTPETEDVAGEISQTLENLIGTAEESAPKAEPKHPTSETTSKFTNLQFGPNYNPTKK